MYLDEMERKILIEMYDKDEPFEDIWEDLEIQILDKFREEGLVRKLRLGLSRRREKLRI